MSSDEARREAEARMQEQREQVGLMVVEQTRFVEGFEQGAEWQAGADALNLAKLRMQAERDAERIAELEAEVEPLRDRAEVDADHIAEGAMAVHEDARRAAEAKLAAVRELVVESRCGADGRVGHSLDSVRLLAVLDGEAAT